MNSQKTYNSRKLIIDSLNEIQRELKVNELTYDGVYVWPIIKIRLFFIATNSISKKNETAPSNDNRHQETISLFSRIIRILNVGFAYFYLCYLQPKRKIKYLTAGIWAHRILDSKRWVNRYFVNLKGSRLHFEYSKLDNNLIDASEITFSAYELFFFHKRFFAKDGNITLEDNQYLREIIDLFNNKTGFKVGYAAFNAQLTEVFKWAGFWEKILRKNEPEEIRVLCYYSLPMYGLCITGNRKSIPVIDMQHGGQGAFHSAYNGFGVTPEGGYNSIPSAFSVWDKGSKTALEKAQIVSKEQIILEGNPWIEFNRNKFVKEQSPEQEKFILYTLQVGIAIPDFVRDAINETAHHCKWVLKTHPRMTEEEVATVANCLQNVINAENVKIDKHTSLFKLLLTSKIHISGFSGSIQEAGLLGVPSVIIDPIGYETYGSLIETEPGYYKYAITKEQFLQHLNNLILN